MAEPAATRVIGRRHAAGVGLASLASAVVSYVVLVLAAHRLSPADNSLFLAYWALLFGAFGVVTGFSSEATRAVHRSSPTGARVVPGAVGLAALIGLVIAASGIWWAPHVLDARHAWLAWVVAAAAVAYAGQLSLQGVLTGRRRWSGVIAITGLDAVTRLVVVLAVVLVAPSLPTLAVASALSAFAWLLLLVFRRVRRGVSTRGDVDLRGLVSNLGHAATASSASALLVVGFPVLIRLLSTQQEYLTSASLLLAISLTRAPLMVPLNAYQGVALTHVMAHRDRGITAIYPIVAVVLGATAAASALADLLGPTVLQLVLGAAYAVDGWVLAWLTASAGLLALLTVTGACVIGLGRHRVYAAGWASATVVAIAVLAAPWSLDVRVPASLTLGPLVGLFIHVAGLRADRTRGVVTLSTPTAGEADA
ncbi:hypothetical protein GCM10027517_02010 [Phycicoccus ginsengisoli]